MIQYTRYKIQDTRSVVQDICVSDTIRPVRGTRLQGAAVLPGTGTNSLRTNPTEYRRKVSSCFIQLLL